MNDQAEGARIVQRALRNVLQEIGPEMPQGMRDRINAAVVAAVLKLELAALKS